MTAEIASGRRRWIVERYPPISGQTIEVIGHVIICRASILESCFGCVEYMSPSVATPTCKQS